MIERRHRSGARLKKFLMPARITGSLIGTRFASKSIRAIIPFSLLKGCLDIVAGLITKMAGDDVSNCYSFCLAGLELNGLGL
jgi:hypothetical protein